MVEKLRRLIRTVKEVSEAPNLGARKLSVAVVVPAFKRNTVFSRDHRRRIDRPDLGGINTERGARGSVYQACIVRPAEQGRRLPNSVEAVAGVRIGRGDIGAQARPSSALDGKAGRAIDR